MKLTPMCVIAPILAKEFNKLLNTSEILGQAPGSSPPVCTAIDEITVTHCFARIKNVRKGGGINF
jgi:hypothetical protein